MKPPASDPAASRPADATGANPGIAFASTCHLFRFYEGGYQAVKKFASVHMLTAAALSARGRGQWLDDFLSMLWSASVAG